MKSMGPVDRLRWLLITSGGLGLSPFAPGTVGTFGGVALAVVIQVITPAHAVAAWWVTAAVLFAFGCSQSAFTARTFSREDPGEFVLDEVVGYLVTVALYATLRLGLPDALPGAMGHTAAFFAFRFFDVVKLQPARKLEDLPGAFGIMADDQMAGVYAGLSIYLVLPLLGY
jgi:phosphatidylglycerophosphatase A